MRHLRNRWSTLLACTLAAGGTAVLPATAAHADFQPDRLSESVRYTSTNVATFDLENPTAVVVGTIDDTGSSRVFHATLTDTVPNDGACVMFSIFGDQSGGQINEVACGGALSFATATSAEDLTIEVWGLDAAGKRVGQDAATDLWSEKNYPLEGVKGTAWSYASNGPSTVVFSLNAYNVRVTGSGFTSTTADNTRFLFATVTPTGTACVNAGFIPTFKPACPGAATTYSAMIQGNAVFGAGTSTAWVTSLLQVI